MRDYAELVARLRSRNLRYGLEDEAADAIEALHARVAEWQGLYRKAINEANGLTNYVEDRPELRSAERRIAAIEAAARTTLESTNGR